jgi:subtilisin-like proprotein convertase family protein
VADGGLTITDVNVIVDLDHAFMGDLDIYFGHDGYGWIMLYEWDGSIDGDDMDQVTFDDEASTFITDGSPPYGPGSFKPLSTNLLSDFDGNSLYGDWHLFIEDRFDYDGGTLNYFAIDVTVVPEPATMLLVGSGLVGLAGLSRRKFKK